MSNKEGTSAALEVQEHLIEIVNKLVSGSIDPEVISTMVKNYVDNNGISASSFMYDRGGVEASTWTIQHNLNKYPMVSIMDDNGNQVEADIHYADLNTVTIVFAKPLSGKAVLT